MIKFFIHLLILFTSLLSTIYCLYNNNHYGYDYIWVLSLLYFIGYAIFYVLLNQKINIFVVMLSAVMYARYVLMSFLLVLTGYDVGRSLTPPLESSYNLAIILMSIEMIVIFMILYFGISKLEFSYKKFVIKPLKNMSIYMIFICVTVIAFLFQPQLWGSVNFLIPNEATLQEDNLSLIGSITYFSLNISRYLLIVLVTSKLSKLYLSSGSHVFMFINYLIVIFLSLIIFGNNRADFLIGFLAVLFFLQIVYKNKALIYNVFFITLSPLIIYFITKSRESISAENNLPFVESITNTLQAYLGGIYNVALAIETKLYFPDQSTLMDLLYDVFRPFLGLNIFFQNVDSNLTNHLFNYRIYGSDHVSQILPSVGQGYFYFGVIFSSFFTVILLLLARYLIKQIIEAKRMDLVLLFLIPIFRLSLIPAQNISIMMNDLSSILVIFVPLYLLNRIFTARKEKE